VANLRVAVTQRIQQDEPGQFNDEPPTWRAAIR
jgi:hypothetical protein